jgi:uncharacterized protein
MTRLARLLIGAVILGLATSAIAETMPSKPDRYFNDYAAVIDQGTALQLNEQLAQFERDTSTQLLVAIYRTMESESDVADYTQRIAQTWGVGQKGRNNGAVLFVFVTNHQMFIQTGYGLEGALPDATCYDITHNVIAPFFKRNDYAGGLKAGITAMMQAVRGEYKGTGRTQKEGETKGNGGRLPIPLIIFLIIVVLTIMSNRGGRRRRVTATAVLGALTLAASAAAAGQAEAARAAAVALAGLAEVAGASAAVAPVRVGNDANEGFHSETRARADC